MSSRSCLDTLNRSIDELIDDFQALTPEDFDPEQHDRTGIERLFDLAKEIELLPQSNQHMPLLFETLERLAEADLGSPGPLVHAIERMGDYGELLQQSYQRKPTPLTTWMINRILNQYIDPVKRELWLGLLQHALNDKPLDDRLQQTIHEFLEWQATKH